MKGYSWSKEDFRELLYRKYFTMDEEVLGCLGIGEQITDYQLCNGDSDLLPTLYKKDEVRFTYNQYANKWSYVSCTIFAAIGMLSDLINYEFSYEQIKEVDDLSYKKGRVKGQGWRVQSAVKLVADRYNNSELSKKYGKVAYYRIDKYDDDIIEDCIDKLYTIDGNYSPNSEYNKDKADGMLDGKDFGSNTSGHSVDIIKKEGVRSVKDSSRTNQIYGLKHKLSEISNYGTYFYIYTLVKEDALEEVKRLNELRTKVLLAIETNSQIWHLVNDENYQKQLNQMNNANRKKLSDIEEQLKKYV